MKRLVVSSFALLLATTIAGCSSSSPPDEPDSELPFKGRTLTVQSVGGAVTEAEKAAFYDRFEAQTGAEVQVVEANAEVGALLERQVRSGSPDWDVLSGQVESTLLRNAALGLLEPIDFSLVPSATELLDGGMHEFGVAYDVESIVAAWSTSVEPLPNMAAFFDSEKYPGKRMGMNWGFAISNCQIALLAVDGPEDLYPLDFDRCLEIWDGIKEDVTVWYDSGAQMAQALVQDEVDYCFCTDGRTMEARKTNPEWKFTLDGGAGFMNYMAIVKGSKNQDMATALLEIVSQPESQAIYAERMGYSPANPNALSLLPPDVQELLAIHPDNQGKLYFQPPEAADLLAEGSDEFDRIWAEWLAR